MRIPQTEGAIIISLLVVNIFVQKYRGEVDKIVRRSVTQSIVEAKPMIPGSKWIVVTSIQYPTKDVKKLSEQTGWTLVVVADRKTPEDWKHPNVHFLSVKMQEDLFGEFATKLPLNSYTRKNLGYLYAILNGAEWIYDTDDDNKPYGLGLAQFDLNETISGLRYVNGSEKIEEKLFNPYRYFGFRNMWPRGFPLEYLSEHSNGFNRMISCRQMRRPAVQQGVVKVDPDVDAIYRLLYAKEGKGLDVSFNPIVPPIQLEKGTYSPWNSQNTLFHYKAFFILYLPTTVAFRVTDIWRSYFGQKLLHLIGENVAFYPVNAVQFRNAHNYLSDFHQEIDVYEKSGRIVQFLDKWLCSKNQTTDCVLELADEFVSNEFFGKEDRDLIVEWIKQLNSLYYVFPALKNSTKYSATHSFLANCRDANLDVGLSSYRSASSDEEKWATKTIEEFSELLDWSSDQKLLSAKGFLERWKNLTYVYEKRNSVLVLVNNYRWYSHGHSGSSIGVLQRLYGPFFKTTVMCGTWSHTNLSNQELPSIRPINFVHITEQEMQRGFNYEYCISKVRDLRLQNITGYFFVSDDTALNIWHETPLDRPFNPLPPVRGGHWRSDLIRKTADLFETKYKNDTRMQASWRRYLEMIEKTYPNSTGRPHFLGANKEVFSDFFYVSADSIDLFADLSEAFTEKDVFVEVAIGKIFDAYSYQPPKSKFIYLWGKIQRGNRYNTYNKTLLGVHPFKLSHIHTDHNERQLYCSTIVNNYREEIYS